jgi:hypothetical protein
MLAVCNNSSSISYTLPILAITKSSSWHEHANSRYSSFPSPTNYQIREHLPWSFTFLKDEMLLRATTGDEHAGGGAPNGSGTPYIDSTLTILMSTSVVEVIERVILRDLIQLTTATGQNPAHISTTASPYPQHPSTVSYPANKSAPVMNSLRPSAQGGQNQVIQTHIFAPVVTGAPTKKTKFPNTIQTGPGSGPGLPGMSLYFFSSLNLLQCANLLSRLGPFVRCWCDPCCNCSICVHQRSRTTNLSTMWYGWEV